MSLNIMKIVDSITDSTVYIMHPQDLHEIVDTPKGCILVYAASRIPVEVHGRSALSLKREIQERLDEPLNFLKLEYTDTGGNAGTRYLNIHDVAGVRTYKNGDKEIGVVVYARHTGELKTMATPIDLARQVRRILLKLDQDQEICCAPTEADEEGG